MLSQMNIEALIGRLQEHALADAPGTMSNPEVDAALALLDRVLPDRHHIELRLADGEPTNTAFGEMRAKMPRSELDKQRPELTKLQRIR